MTYTDFLQRRELDDHLAFQITGPIKELITANDHALSAQINALEQISAAQAQAAYEVVCAIRDLQVATEEGFRRVGSILEWGFDATLIQLGRINDQLSEIRNLLQNPSLTWAYEQFNRARDRYRRGHYSDALESVDNALGGHGTELGDKTEHRFHYLRGIILLGSMENNSSEIVDLPEAETAFLKASKYAAHDFPFEAGDALMCAAHAANHQGRFSEAAGYAEKGLRFQQTAGLHYELARSLLALERQQDAAYHLLWAIRLDKNLVLKASGDPAFLIESGFLENVFTEGLTELRALSMSVHEAIVSELSSVDATTFKSTSTNQSYRAAEGCADVISVSREAASQLAFAQAKGGILDHRLAIENGYRSYSRLMTVDTGFREFVCRSLENLAKNEENSTAGVISARHRQREQSDGLRKAMPFLIGGGLGLWYAIYWISGGTFHGFVEGVIGGPIVGFVIGWITFVVLKVAGASWASEIAAIRARSRGIQESIRREARSARERVFIVPHASLDDIVPGWARPAPQ